MKYLVFFFILIYIEITGQNLQETIVRPLDPGDGDRFGSEVALKDSLLFITAITDDDPVINSGSAYIFRKNGNIWTQIQKIPGTVRSNSGFGISLSVSNDNKILIGAPDDTAVTSYKTGVAYLYEYQNNNWVLSQRIYPAELDSGILQKGFGHSVEIAENLIVIGAPWDGTISSRPGSVYIFEKDSVNWFQSSKITITDNYQYAYFGNSVVYNNYTLFVGAPGVNDLGNNSGSVYIYSYEKGEWVFKQKLQPNDLQPEDFFGGRLTVYNDILAVTAYGSIGAVNYRGAVYIFEKRNNEWIEKQKIVPENDLVERFGGTIKLYKDTLLIGAIDTNSISFVNLYIKENQTWIKKYEFRESISESGISFGNDVDLIDGIFSISATGYFFNSGAMYIYQPKPVNVNDYDTEAPSEYVLFQNYPNPFNPTTRINYRIKVEGMAELKVYDILGREVTTLVYEMMQPGNYTVNLNGKELASGVYIYKLMVNDFVTTKKMILIR